jgi:hypothetical protein
MDYFNKNNIKTEEKTSSVPTPLKAIDIFKKYKAKFFDFYKSSNNYSDKRKYKDTGIPDYEDIKANQINSSNYTTDKDTDFISNFNSYEENIHLRYNNILTDKINKTKEEEFNTEEIDKIQKDILKILQRLENSP